MKLDERFQREIPPMPLRFQMRGDAVLQRIHEMEDGNMKKRYKLSTALACAMIAVVLIAATAFAASSGILAMFFGGEGRDANLNAELAGGVQAVNAAGEGKYLKIEMQEAMLTGDTFAASWTATNLSGERIWIDDPAEFTLNGECFNLGGALSRDIEYFLEPGESVPCGVKWNLIPENVLDENVFRMSLSVYAPGDGEAEKTLLESVTLEVPVALSETKTLSALEEDAPLEFDMGGYKLVITRADMSAALLTMEYNVIFENEAAALDNPPYCWKLTDAEGERDWWENGCGSIGDAVQMEDGSWAYAVTMQCAVLRHPEQVVFEPCTQDWEGPAENGVALEFK